MDAAAPAAAQSLPDDQQQPKACQKVVEEAAGAEAAGAEEAGPAAEKVPTLYILLNVTHFLRMSHKQINK